MVIYCHKREKEDRPRGHRWGMKKPSPVSFYFPNGTRNKITRGRRSCVARGMQADGEAEALALPPGSEH